MDSRLDGDEQTDALTCNKLVFPTPEAPRKAALRGARRRPPSGVSIGRRRYAAITGVGNGVLLSALRCEVSTSLMGPLPPALHTVVVT